MTKANLRGRYANVRSIETDQTARISLQKPIMSKSNRRQTTNSAPISLSAAANHLSGNHAKPTLASPASQQQYPAAGEALSRTSKQNTQEGKQKRRSVFFLFLNKSNIVSLLMATPTDERSRGWLKAPVFCCAGMAGQMPVLSRGFQNSRHLARIRHCSPGPRGIPARIQPDTPRGARCDAGA